MDTVQARNPCVTLYRTYMARAHMLAAYVALAERNGWVDADLALMRGRLDGLSFAIKELEGVALNEASITLSAVIC